MKRAVREHSRDFVAIVVLLVLGLATTGLILSQQQAPYPAWIPFLGDERFELKAEFETAQAVVPGQGQTVNIAGVEVGDVTDVELERGRAVVTMAVRTEYAPLIGSNATMLLRPRTGLQDMTVEVDVSKGGEPLEDGATIPVAQTKPNVMPDQILASLDRDTRDYLQLLISGGAEGLGGHGREFSAGLRRFEPLGRYLAEVNTELAKRRDSIRRSITSFRELAEALGRSDTRLAEFVTAQNDALGAFANQQASIRETLRELPPTLRETQTALESSDQLSAVLGPTSEALIPAAQAFAPGQVAAQNFARQTVDPIRTQIRPFSRQVQPTVRHLKQASGPLGETATNTATSVTDVNSLFNAWAYNPPGSEEGYLFWTAWLNHNNNNIARIQDAHGPILRGIVLQSCATADLAETLAIARPFIRTLQQVTNAPQSDVICQIDPP